MRLSKPTKSEVAEIRAIAKELKIKGCRQPLHAVIVGRQTHRINPETANTLVERLSKAGFFVETCCTKLISRGLADTFLIHKIAA